MPNITSEIRRSNPGNVLSGGKVAFDIQTQFSNHIVYDVTTAEFVFDEPGLYSVKWWVATETAPKGAIEFALISSEGHNIPADSPVKTGQISGFAAINVREAGCRVWLENIAESTHTVFSNAATTKAYLLVTQINSANPSGLVDVQHANLSVSGNYREITIGKVIYRLEYASATAIAMFLKSTGETVIVDVKRSAQYDTGGIEGLSLNNFSLTTTPRPMDGTIYNSSNEMHRTWIRQQDPVTGLWSMHEVDLFSSDSGKRVSICVYLIYEDVDLSGL